MESWRAYPDVSPERAKQRFCRASIQARGGRKSLAPLPLYETGAKIGHATHKMSPDGASCEVARMDVGSLFTKEDIGIPLCSITD